MTINEQIQLIKNFADSHPMINGSTFAPEYLVNREKNHDGVVLWYFVESSQVEQTVRRDTYVITAMDVLNEDRGNLADILSDTMQILEDMFAYLVYHEDEQKDNGTYYNYIVTRGATFEPGEQLYNAMFAGYTVRITIESPTAFDYCQFPDDSVVSGDWILESGFWVDANVWDDTAVWID